MLKRCAGHVGATLSGEPGVFKYAGKVAGALRCAGDCVDKCLPKMDEILTTSAPDEPVAHVAAPDAAAAAELEWENLATGSRWRTNYHIGEQLEDITHGRIFKAAHVGNSESFYVRAFKVPDDTRKAVWDQLVALKGEGFIEVMEAAQADGKRAEVVRAAPTTTLREWTTHRKLAPGEIELLVRQLTQALHGLHQGGLVHLNLRPDTIFIKSTDAGLRAYIGGLECVASYKDAGHFVHSVDPYFAPPEAAGLYQFNRDKSLRAWDWWTLGRVVQEVVLGKHVMGHILDRDVSRQTQELKVRAEDMLKEQDITKSRAGGVECMPAMDKRLNSLLRGLLTSSRDARWGPREIERWLAKEEIKDRYQLPKDERLFIWKDAAYTVAEAAEMFAQKENWVDGLTNLFAKDNPDTLAVFMADGGVAHKVWQRAEALLAIVGSPAVKGNPEPMVKEAVASLVWATLAGGEFKMMVRGQRLDEACLRELLKPESLVAGLELTRVLILRGILQHIEQLDVDAARVLNDFEKTVAHALEVTTKNKWLTDDPKLHARLLTLCLDPVVTLNGARAEMHRRYACSRDKLLDKFFKRTDCHRGELAVVVFTGTEPQKYEYVSKEEWNQEQYRLLKERGEKLSATIVWMRLGRALGAGPLVFGTMKIMIVVWVLAGVLLMLAGRNFAVIALAFVPAALAWFIRASWRKIHERRLRNVFPMLEHWGIRDGEKRCLAEAMGILETDTLPGPQALLRSLLEINAEIKKLELKPAPKLLPLPPGFRITWLGVGLGWMLLALTIAAIAWQAITNPLEGATRVAVTSTTRKADEEKATKGVDVDDARERVVAKTPDKEPEEMEQLAEGESMKLAAAVEELRQLKAELDRLPKPPPKIAWGFKLKGNPQIVRVRKVETGDAGQVATAEETAKMMLDRFKPETIDAIIAVQVPVRSGVGLMFYDGAAGKLTGRDVVVINYVPLPRTWLEIGENRVFFLGTK